ncbi:MAG: hypothetical protein NTZ52_00910 [Chlamydiae bacterium]|nr:hypothetical protein [Chlamydiota bacterium]
MTDRSEGLITAMRKVLKEVCQGAQSGQWHYPEVTDRSRSTRASVGTCRWCFHSILIF